MTTRTRTKNTDYYAIFAIHIAASTLATAPVICAACDGKFEARRRVDI